MLEQGTHVLADVWLASWRDMNLDGVAGIIRANGMTIVGDCVKVFPDGGGLTAIWLLAESHFSIHTYPERNYLSIDCYTCGATSPLNIVNQVLEGLEIRRAEIRVLQRGV